MTRRDEQARGEVIIDKLKEFLGQKSTMSELYEGETGGKTNVEKLLELLEKYGNYLANQANLNTSQIRKFFDTVKKIEIELQKPDEISETQVRQRVLRLKPSLAYAVARQRRKLKPFADIIYRAIDMVKTKKDFIYFVEFVESIIAYHKYHGGRD